MNLHELLEMHVKIIKDVAKRISEKPNDDFAPILSAFKDDQVIATAIIEIPTDRRARSAMHEAVMNFLIEKHADAYTMTLSAWRSSTWLTSDELHEHMRSGASVADRADRMEVVTAIAGNEQETLSEDFEIIRTSTGRISYLKYIERTLGKQATVGLFFDMLKRPSVALAEKIH